MTADDAGVSDDGGDATVSSGPPDPPTTVATAIGDPHLLTFSRTRYDCQIWGEATLCLAGNDLEVQMRTHQWGVANVAVIHGVAARVGGDRVAIYLDGGTTANGSPLDFAPTGTQLDGGGKVWKTALNAYVIRWPDNSQLRIKLNGSYMNAQIYIAEARKSQLSGLLGSGDGGAGHDLVPRGGGVPLVSPATFEQFYGDGGYYSGYAGSWRIAPDASLFDYPDGESTQTPDITVLNFPTRIETVDSLGAGEVDASAAICAQQMVTQDWMTSCELDVSLTGEAGAANSFVGAPAVSASFDIVPEPTVISEVESGFSGTWTWNGTGYNGTWNNGAVAVLTVESFTQTSIVLDRTDTSISASAGLSAVYTGTITVADSGTGGSVVNGSATWTWPGHSGFPATGTWSATW